MNVESLWSLKELAEYLNIAEKTVYSYAQKGQIPGFKIVGNWRFDPEDIKAWVEAQKSETKQSIIKKYNKQQKSK